MRLPRPLVALIACFVLTSPPVVAAGQPADAATTFKGHCVVCHGADGSAETPMGKKLNIKDMRSDEVQKMPPSEIARIITDGKGKMASYKSRLTAAQIDDLAKFIKLMKK